MNLPMRGGRGMRAQILVLATVLAFLIACGGGSDGGSGSNGAASGATTGGSLSVPSDDSLTVTSFELPLPGSAVAYAFDLVWVFAFDLDDGPKLYALDPETKALKQTLDVPTVTPAMLAGSDALWLAGRALFRVEAGSSVVEQVAYRDLPDLGFTPTWGIWGDRIFVLADDGKIFELNTSSGSFSLLADSGAADGNTAAFAGQHVWIENAVEISPTQIRRTLIGIDLSSGTEVASVEIDATSLQGGDEAIWALPTLLSNEGQGFYRIEPFTGEPAFQELDFDEVPFLVSIGAEDETVWLSYQGSNGGDFVLTVSGGKVSRATVESAFPALTVGGGAAWLVDPDVPRLERVTP